MRYNFRLAFWALTLVCGAFLAWDARHLMDSDGISYLDIGDAYFHGDWIHAINAFWSPLYSWFLGFALWLLNPSSYWEFPVVHLVNYLIFICAAGTFDFFLGQFIRFYREKIAEARAKGWLTLSEGLVRTLGYALFLWTTLHMIDLATVTPDICVAAIFFWMVGILVKIRRGVMHPLTFFIFGLALALGYLAKATMFLFAFVFLTASVFLVRPLKQTVRLLSMALMGFALLAGPFITALSIQKGRLTYSDSGPLTYASTINFSDVTLDHWRGEPPESGHPHHPTRKIFEQPAVYEFRTPVGGTFPLWYDPSYWREGVRPRFDLKEHLRVARAVFGGQLPSIFFGRWRWFLVFAVLLLFYLGGRGPSIFNDLREYGFLWIPVLTAFGIYFIFNVEPRRLAPFLALSWLLLFAAVRLPLQPVSQRALRGITLAAVGAMLFSIVVPTARAAWTGAQEWIRKDYRSGHPMWEIARQLNSVGIASGDLLATIGEGNLPSQWARLARVRLIAEVPRAQDFWVSPSAIRRQIAQALKKTGVKALVAERVPPSIEQEGWRQIGNTGYYVQLL